MFRQFILTVALVASAASLTACGGGEDYEEPMDQAFEAPTEPPQRGVEWLAVTMEVPASGEI
jgi:hypothetical protein